MQHIKTSLCIIGGGAAGLTMTSVAAQLDLDVVLVEGHKMGGDCLNYGCVPSKALISCAKAANFSKQMYDIGIDCNDIQVNFNKAMQHVHHSIKQISPKDSVERFTKLGARVITEKFTFINTQQIQSENYIITAKRFVIATGSTPSIPPVEGISTTPYLTNETIFELTELPEHLIIIGGGPIGCEIAQAFKYLGAKVTLLEAFRILPRDNADLVKSLKQKMIHDGITLYENIQIDKIMYTKKIFNLKCVYLNKTIELQGSHLLVAAGRKPNLENLNLKEARVKFNQQGIVVNSQLRTTNKKIYAIGDVINGYQFTHVSEYEAGIAIQNIIFHLPKKASYKAIPWVTYTTPELAHVGISWQMVENTPNKYKIIELPFSDNDRAICENQTIGKIKVITNPTGVILGASILSPNASELISLWTFAIQNKLKMKHMASLIVPYPTRSEISKRAAGSFYSDLLFSNKSKILVKLLSNLP